MFACTNFAFLGQSIKISNNSTRKNSHLKVLYTHSISTHNTWQFSEAWGAPPPVLIPEHN